MVAMAHVVLMFSNIRTPRCARAAAKMKDGMRKAAIAEAAKLGYESITHQFTCSPGSGTRRDLTGNVVQHTQPQQGISEAKDTSSNNRAPIRGLAVASKREP